MKAFFSWLKKNVTNADLLSSAFSFTVCVLLFAGMLAAFANFQFAKRFEAETESVAEPTRLAVKLFDFMPVPEPVQEEVVPEEPPPLPPPPEPPKKEEPRPEPPEIKEDAVLETVKPVEDPPPPPPEPPKKEEPPPLEPEPEPLPPPPPPASKPPPPPPVQDNSAQLAAAKRSAEQTLYGALADAVRREKFYPRSARRNGRTGTVSVRVKISSAGKITHTELVPGNAHKSLQDGAMKTLRKVAEDFVAPRETAAALPAAFIVPVIYELR